MADGTTDENPKPGFNLWDPLLGIARSFDAPYNENITPIDPSLYRPIEGYDVFPPDISYLDADPRIVTLGGSTSDRLCGGNWPMFLADLLSVKRKSAMVMNGGCASYNSSMELTKLMRDGPALKPHIVISLSGINDFGFLHCIPSQPMIHPFQIEVATELAKTDSFQGVTLGLSAGPTPPDHWLRNMRLIRAVAEDLGATYVAFLQPVLGVGAYRANGEEKKMLEDQSPDTLYPGGPYLEEINKQFEAVRSHLGDYPHVVDISGVFDGQAGMYQDYRHPNDKGYKVIATRMFEELSGRKMI